MTGAAAGGVWAMGRECFATDASDVRLCSSAICCKDACSGNFVSVRRATSTIVAGRPAAPGRPKHGKVYIVNS